MNKKTTTSSNMGGVLLFVGPPGVGKTSLGQSIAKSLKRKFVKISVGGVSDESEIKGHRRTYVGSFPGRIISAMKKAGSLDPVVMIDEIDKMGAGRAMHGNSHSALLEVLDVNENSAFVDSYLNIPYDLSNVVFICTANSLESIPSPLLDRMEVIRLSSYTYLEKVEIAKRHLIPAVLKNFSMDKGYSCSFTDEALNLIIKHYTQEAGVRQLRRAIEKVLRKFLVDSFEKGGKELLLEEDNVQKFLGEKIFNTNSNKYDLETGVVNGLAYTDFGGDILNIEVGFFKGTGKTILTGTLGDVMKESANIAIDYIRQNADLFSIDTKIFTENNIHIHVPEGATPKDGPSGGIAITTAIISSLKNILIPSSLAMTGEITLRGKVLAIGGLKEKLIAAHSNGVKTVIIPDSNKHKIDEVPKEILDEIEIILVKNYQEVWEKISGKKVLS